MRLWKIVVILFKAKFQMNVLAWRSNLRCESNVFVILLLEIWSMMYCEFITELLTTCKSGSHLRHHLNDTSRHWVWTIRHKSRLSTILLTFGWCLHSRYRIRQINGMPKYALRRVCFLSFTAEKWCFIFRNEDASNLFTILQYVLSIPVSNAAVKIVFTVMERKLWQTSTIG